MFPQRVAERMDRVWMVAQWKYGLDSTTPWYRQFFFKYVFRPFIHFSWNVMKIPCPKGVEIKGSSREGGSDQGTPSGYKATIFWFENGGFFSTEDQAEIACTGYYDGYKDVPLDRAFPPESAQYSSLVFPRQKSPRQHRRRPNFSIVATPREEITNLEKKIMELEKQVNQLRRAVIR